MNRYWQNAYSDGSVAIAFEGYQIASLKRLRDSSTQPGMMTELLFSTIPGLTDHIGNVTADLGDGEDVIEVDVRHTRFLRCFAWGPVRDDGTRLTQDRVVIVEDGQDENDVAAVTMAQLVSDLRNASSGAAA